MADPVALHNTERHILPSRHVGREMQLWIGKPLAGFVPSPAAPHVLWVLDGDLFFGTAVELTRLMHQLYGELPPILVVGVAYGTTDPRVQGELRTRDFTPTADPSFEEMGMRMNPTWTPVLPEGQRMAGAAAFHRFLVDEARPYVDERFPTSGKGTLFGTSLGGLFVTWSMLTEPEAFDHHVAVSPALWWDDGAVLSLEKEVAATRRDLDAKLFMAAGSLEEPEHLPFLARFRLVSNVRTMKEQLDSRGYASLDARGEVFQGETHTSMVSLGLTRGLRAFLRGTPPAMPRPPAPKPE